MAVGIVIVVIVIAISLAIGTFIARRRQIQHARLQSQEAPSDQVFGTAGNNGIHVNNSIRRPERAHTAAHDIEALPAYEPAPDYAPPTK